MTNGSVRISVDHQAYRYTALNDCGIFYINPHEATEIPRHVNTAVDNLKKGRGSSLLTAVGVISNASAASINLAVHLIQHSILHGEQYHTTTVNSYLLLNSDQLIIFRKPILKIMEWGRETRLKQIRAALDGILVATQRRTAAESKARLRPE